MLAGYEDAVAQFLSGRETTFSVAKVLGSLEEGTGVVRSHIVPHFNIDSVLSRSVWTIDLAGNLPENSETLDIRGVSLTLVTGTPASANEVKIQGTAANMALVLSNAINGDYDPDVHTSTERSPYVTASAVSTILALTSRREGRPTANYSIVDWNGDRQTPSTEGGGDIPVLTSLALECFGSFLFAGGGRDIQGQGKGPSRRYEVAVEVLKDYISGALRLESVGADGTRTAVPRVSTTPISDHELNRDYTKRREDLGDEYYTELRARKGLD